MALSAKKKYRPIIVIALIALLFAILSIKVLNEDYRQDVPKGDNTFDVIIVLGSPAKKQCTPTSIMKQRTAKGVELFKQGLSSRILFTGGAVANKCVEAEVMKEYALSLGVPDSCILTEEQARNTYQNAYYSVQIMKRLDLHSAAIVTSEFHCRRAGHIFKNYDINFGLFPCENPPRSFKLYYWKAREFCILLYHSIMGYPTDSGQSTPQVSIP